jgi:hypothetical protein
MLQSVKAFWGSLNAGKALPTGLQLPDKCCLEKIVIVVPE